jgi:hypothetical protein
LHKIIQMKVLYTYISFLGMALLNSCAEGDKKADANTSIDGPNIVIDSTGYKTASGGNNATQITTKPTNTVTQTMAVPQQQTVTQQGQNVQVTPQQQQQQIQQQIQQQMQQQAAQPQQVQTVQQVAHPQFTDVQFKKMQDDAKSRGVQLNPAHGQPNHRCDIYVGQPLDSKAVPELAQQQPAAVTATTPQTVSVAPQPVKVEAGMNPAHGQPGHRCDIAVGAPLSSKPVTPGTQTTPVQAQPATPAMGSKTDSARGGK